MITVCTREMDREVGEEDQEHQDIRFSPDSGFDAFRDVFNFPYSLQVR
jgi:hypothetical protein